MRRESRALILLLPLVIALCGDDHGCPVYDVRNWGRLGFNSTVTTPSRCPISVVVGAYQTFEATTTNSNYDFVHGQLLFTRMTNNEGRHLITFTAPWTQTGGTGRAQTQGSYPAGTGQTLVGQTTVKDVANQSTNVNKFSPDNYAEAEVFITYTLLRFAGVDGPSSATVGQATSWTANPQWGIPPYSYQWMRNGGAISGAVGTSYSYTAPLTGTFTVGRIMTDRDSRSDTMTKSVSGVYTAAVSGPSSLVEGNMGRWDVAAAGGYAPFAYEWWVDGIRQYRNMSFYQGSFSEGGSTHEVMARITDSYGNTSTGSRSVYVTFGSGLP